MSSHATKNMSAPPVDGFFVENYISRPHLMDAALALMVATGRSLINDIERYER